MALNGYEHLKLDFEGTAEWRATCAERFPDDDRNSAAMEELNHLYSTVDSVSPELMNAYVELCEHVEDIEKHQEMLREIGFNKSYSDATEFVRRYIADRCGA